MNAIIIEDEKRTAQDLQQILRDLMPDIEILSIIDSVEESIDYLTRKRVSRPYFLGYSIGGWFEF